MEREGDRGAVWCIFSQLSVGGGQILEPSNHNHNVWLYTEQKVRVLLEGGEVKFKTPWTRNDP